VTDRVRLILASASPARRRLLQAAGLAPEVIVSGVEEAALAGSWATPIETALGLARAKAADVAAGLALGDDRALVVGCDSVLEVPTVAELAGRALGKPRDARDAARRWALMGGHEGLLHTGHCLIDVPGGTEFSAAATTTVTFCVLTPQEVDAYVASGEPLSVAGAFTLDGRGGAFVRRVDGDPSNVIGLSLPLLRELMAQAGVFWPSLWQGPANSPA
jgi:septum formation protein